MSGSSIRFRVDPRGISPAKAARRLGITLPAFEAAHDELRARRFPPPDPTTGNYDLKAIDAWMDRESGLTPENATRDASSRIRSRLEGLYGTDG